MQAALVRDGRHCRWPRCEYRTKKLPIDPSHVFAHRGMGGNPHGDRTARQLIVALCRVHHGWVDAGDAKVEPMSAADLADGCLSFYVRTESGRWHCVGTEARISVSVSRGER